MNGTASALQSLRVSCGRSQQELAAELGLTLESYWDLERFDDELVSAISLLQARALAEALNVDLAVLLKPNEANPSCSLQQLTGLLRARVGRSTQALLAAEDAVGWELVSFLDSPAAVAEQRPIVFLQELAAYCEVGWSGLLARANAA